MSTDWRWEYDHDHVAGGIPVHVVAEVERLADQLVDLASTGTDVSDLGNGPRPGGLRRMDAADGWFYFLVTPRDPLIIIVRLPLGKLVGLTHMHNGRALLGPWTLTSAGSGIWAHKVADAADGCGHDVLCGCSHTPRQAETAPVSRRRVPLCGLGVGTG